MIVDAADPLASRRRSPRLPRSAVGPLAAARATPAEAESPPLEVRVRPWYNPGLRSAVYIVPGIIGVLLSLTLVLITSMAIVRERERGTLEQLIVTPIDKTSLMLGKILPFLLIGYVQITVILLLGRLLFRVPILGSLPLLYLLSLPVHRREPGARTPHVHAGAEPGSGDAAQLPLSAAQHPVIRLHVSPPGDAAARAVDRRRAAAHLLSSRFFGACCSRASGSSTSGPRRWRCRTSQSD